MQNEDETPHFLKIKNLGPVEISGGNKSQDEKCEFSLFWSHFLARFPDFKVLLVEISEVLPVEITAPNPVKSQLSLGKNKSFGPIYRPLPTNTPTTPLHYWFWSTTLYFQNHQFSMQKLGIF